MHVRDGLLRIVGVASSLMIAGCASAPATGSAWLPPPPAAAAVVRPALMHLTPPSGGAWHPLPTLSQGVAGAYEAHPSPSEWELWMDPTLVGFRFVPGTRWPERSPVRAVDRRPSTWVPRLVAAFNGGFKLSDHAGGYFYAGRVVAPLRPGLASLAVGLDGSLRVAVWGRDLSSTTGLLAVRQNLPPLVDHGLPMTRSTDGVTTWGLPYHHIVRTNRSALGERADGSLVYVYLHDAVASELAAALVDAGAVTGIALDMNTGWPAALTFRHVGATVASTRLSPVMTQYLNAYYSRPQKDFVAVEAKP